MTPSERSMKRFDELADEPVSANTRAAMLMVIEELLSESKKNDLSGLTRQKILERYEQIFAQEDIGDENPMEFQFFPVYESVKTFISSALLEMRHTTIEECMDAVKKNDLGSGAHHGVSLEILEALEGLK